VVNISGPESFIPRRGRNCDSAATCIALALRGRDCEYERDAAMFSNMKNQMSGRRRVFPQRRD